MNARTLICLSLLSTTCLPMLAAAQETTSSTTLGTINVTSDGDTDGLAGTGPVGVVTATDIAKKQAGSVASALQDIPGVHVARGDDLLNAGIGIRGFGGNGVMPNDPNVVVNIDGADANAGSNYRNAGMAIADPALIKNIKVLKGPLASIPYGSGIAGGTVAAETINAADLTGDKPGVKFRQLLGANSNGQGWVTSSTFAWQPDENFDMLLNYTRRSLDEQKNGDGDKIGSEGFNVPSYLLKARYRFGAAHEHALTFSHSYSESAERDVLFGAIYNNVRLGNVNRDRKSTVTGLSYTYTAPGNDLVDLEVKYSRSRQEMSITPITASATFGGDYNLNSDKLAVTNTARFAGFGIGHELQTGLEWSEQKRDKITAVTPMGKDRRIAAFAIDQMDFGNALTVTAGARIERQKMTDAYTYGRTAPVPVGPYENTARTAGLGFEQGLGFGYAVFGSFAYGEGLGNVDALRVTASDTGLNGVDYVQKSRNWEAGLKYSGTDAFLAGDRLTASVTLYKTEIWDAHSFTQSAMTGFDFSGVEAQLAYEMASGFYSRLTATVVDNDQINGTGTTQDYIYSPADSAALTLGQRWQNGVDLSWTLRGNAGTDSYNESTNVKNGTHAGWGTSDINVSYTPTTGVLADTTINFGVENLFDKQYTYNLSTYDQPGRNFKLTLSKTF
ncbi:MAG TPA: TonB-dependent receptor [Paenirhodobacter sp.]